jgi:hypothetical protein
LVVGALARATPASRNLLITAHELASARLSAPPVVRERVFQDASRLPLNISRAVPASPLAYCALASAIAWSIVFAASRFESTVTRLSVPRPASSPVTARTTVMTVDVTIHSPAYTGLPDARVVDPAELRALEGSVAVITIESNAPRIAFDHDGTVRTLTPVGTGRFVDRLPLTKTGYLVVAPEGGDRRTIPVVVTPDALPSVRITDPGRDLVLSGGNLSIAFTTRATDDYGLRSLSLRYTKVSGSGEEFEFTEGEIPLRIAAANARDWTGTAGRTIAQLGLHEGDMLVYRAVAADERPGGGAAQSDAYFVEISRVGVAAGDAFTLPEQETKYALSQQMLIVKTDRLIRQRGAMPQDQFAESSLNLAVEQRMIRAEFVFMLGGEIEDEEVEAERSVELQSGRLANRGQSDLRAATIAMSQAEKLLTAANPADALVAEHNAVAALQRAFARDRYILRASPSRVDLDPKRRLTGDRSSASGWTRQVPDTPANRRAAQLQDLLQGVSELPSDSDRSRVLLMAETALRIDAQSPTLRQTATTLQQAAGSWTAWTVDARRRAIEPVVTAIAAEARRALPAAPVNSTDVAPGLRRALEERER